MKTNKEINVNEKFVTITYKSSKYGDKVKLDVGEFGTIKYNGKVLKQHKLQNGYMYCAYVPGFRGLLPVHRLICFAYDNSKKITKSNRNKWHAAHIDGDRLNNVATNLQWQTRKQNNSFALTRKRQSENARHDNHKNEMIKAEKNNDIKYFKSGYHAARYIGCSHVLVYNVLSNRNFAKSAKGWKLAWVKCEDIDINEKEKSL